MMRISAKEKRMVPIGEAAKILGVSIDTIRRWDKSGKLHCERLNGKDRFFSWEELEKIKFAKALSISEAALQLKISPATLRRLEKKNLISPKRAQSGERIYDRDVIRKFLESEYFVREGKIKERVLGPSEKYKLNQKEPVKDITFERKTQPAHNLPEVPLESSEKINLYRNLTPLQRVPEVLATIIVFLLLLTFGLRNVIISIATRPNSSIASAVLSTTTKSSSPSADLSAKGSITPTVYVSNTPSPIPSTPSAAMPVTKEMKSNMTLTVKTDDEKTIVNIRQRPTTASTRIGQAKNGDTFEYVSEIANWYEVKLATGSGFISATYAEVREEINE